MNETQADPQRLSSIDAATSLGRLADEVVVALAHRIDRVALGPDDVRALTLAADWLNRLSDQLANPLDLSRLGDVAAFPGLYGFGPDVTGAAIDAIGSSAGRQAEVEALRALRDTVRNVPSDTSDPETLHRLLRVFESIARAMLSAAGSMLAPPARSAWATTSVS